MKAFNDSKKRQQKCMNVFWYVKVYIFWKFIQYTTQWDKTQMLKKFPSNKTTVTKKCTLFPLVDSNYHSFTFNSKSLYKLKHMVHLFKTVCGILDFPFHLVFIKHYIFVHQTAWTLWLPELSFLSCNKFENSMYELELPQNWLDTNFLNL